MNEWAGVLAMWVGLAIMVYSIMKFRKSKREVPPPASSSVEVEMGENKPESKKSRFQGYSWQWPVKKANEFGCDVPEGQVEGDVVVKILLQEIRDNNNTNMRKIADLLDKQHTELVNLNAYLRQMFGKPEGSA